MYNESAAQEEYEECSDAVVNTKINKAQIKLSKKADGLNFFGACAYSYAWSIHSMPGMNAEGYVLFDKDTKDIEDGTIHINYDLVKRKDYTHIHLAYIICHELLHILGRHGLRKGQRDHGIWAAACDHVVERDLMDVAHSVVPYDDRYHYFEKLHKEQPTCSVEQAYDWIVKQINAGNIQVHLVAGDSMVEVTDENGNTFTINVQVGGTDPKKVKGNSAQVLQTNEKVLAEARALHEIMKSRGTSPGSLTSLLDSMLAVEIPWEKLLEKSLKTNVQMRPDDRTWKMPNKIYRPLGILLPGQTMMEEREGVGLIIYATDSSGSMSDEELKKCSSVVHQSFQYFKYVWLYVHDVDVKQKKEFDKTEAHKFMSFLKVEGYEGRGGTSHNPVFDRIQKEAWETDEYNAEISLVICLTDGYSDIESSIKKYEWCKSIPIVFVIFGGHQINVSQENVTVINVE
jgi:predicted metal-dependent peptidase